MPFDKLRANGRRDQSSPPSMLTWPGLPILVKLDGRPVILLGEGEGAEAKRRLLMRAGATVVDDHPDARLAVVAIEDEVEAVAAVTRLRARGVLVNAVDRPALCDFTLPAVVDRAPVLVAVMTGGVSAGLAAAVRQRLEGVLPAGLGALATALFDARAAVKQRWPDAGERRRALARGMAAGGALDPLATSPGDDRVRGWLDGEAAGTGLGAGMTAIRLRSADPDDLTLRQARALALADRVYHAPSVPPAILDRARADAARVACGAAPDHPPVGASVWVEGP